MALTKCPECGGQVAKSANTCPHCGKKGPFGGGSSILSAIGALIKLSIAGFVLLFFYTCTKTMGDRSEPVPRATPAAASSGPMLRVQSWSCSYEGDYVYVRGEVTNLTSQNLKSIMAVATHRTDSGEFIVSDDAFLEYDPILPGQTSPFKVMTPKNPRMARCSLNFKRFGGGTVSFESADD